MKRIDLKKIIKEKALLIFSSLFLSFTICFFAPGSIYLSNVSEFWFNLYHIMPLMAGSFIVFGLLIIVVGIVVEKLLGAKNFFIYETLVLSGGICTYVHSNFLNMTVGTFDGAKIEWDKYRPQMIGNLLCWIGIIVAVFVIRILLKKYVEKPLKYLPLLLTFLELVAFVSLLFMDISNGNTIWNKNTLLLSDQDVCDMGDEDNIIVFILDMFDATSMRQIIENESSICDELDGFTLYDNYTGLYEYTGMSLNNIINRANYWVEGGTVELPDEKYIDNLINDGYDISIYTDQNQVIEPDLRCQLSNYSAKMSKFRNFRTEFALMFKMVACQYLPDIVKPYIWLMGDEFNNARISYDGIEPYSTNNQRVRDIFTSRDYKVYDGKKYYKIIHTDGAHDPFDIDSECNDMDPNWDDYLGTCRGSLRIVQRYLQHMKENGTYDSSHIIITADHGYRSDVIGLLTSPVMMIKTKGANGTLIVSNAPVSQDDLSATVLKLAGDADYSRYGIPIMDVPEDSKRERVTYNHSGVFKNGRDDTFGIMKYTVKPESNDWESFVIEDIELTPSGRFISHFDNCKTCQKNEQPTDFYGWTQLVHYPTDEYLKEEDKK